MNSRDVCVSSNVSYYLPKKPLSNRGFFDFICCSGNRVIGIRNSFFASRRSLSKSYMEVFKYRVKGSTPPDSAFEKLHLTPSQIISPRSGLGLSYWDSK